MRGFAAALALLAAACGPPPDEMAAPPAAGARFVGGAACAGCHAREAELWRGSHHDLAMQAATDATVRGDFANAQFTYGETTTTFFREGGRFLVRTDGPDGQLADFEITHTFGVEPLQQYLVALPGGRRQALGIAWDTRPAEDGGGRWFHLYPAGDAVAGEALHWTSSLQNWNAACAQCHSTALDKHYDLASDTYATAWADIDVSCEACHGPGSAHVANPMDAPLALAHTPRAWVLADGAAVAARVPAQARDAEIEICAQCHARRSQHGEELIADEESLLDAFRPALLETGLYHADGQIDDEVYVYGSFVQSAMHAAGVVCSDCHEPHSARLRRDGDELCAQCHAPARFAAADHHRHAPESAGARCVACHMPEKTYMGVDPRRDHSFRVPRPDLSVELGTPNACGGCHAEHPPEWAAAAVAEWYPRGRRTEFHYGQAIAAARRWQADRAVLLERIVGDPAVPGIARATGVALLGAQLDDAALALIEQRLGDPDPLVQLAALDALEGAPAAFVAQSAQRFLSAASRAQRLAAARVLVPARALLSERRRADLARALEEYRAAQEFHMDRAEGFFNWGTTLAALGRAEEAEQNLRAAIARDPAFAPAYVNLADVIRRRGREAEAESVLREALARAPGDASLRFSLGLSLVRLGQLDAAIAELAHAAEAAPDAPQYAYTLGVALGSTAEPERGLDVLRAAHARFPGHAETLLALATTLRDAGRTQEALEHARKLAATSPGSTAARRLLAELETAP